jgi:hypothetical protein
VRARFEVANGVVLIWAGMQPSRSRNHLTLKMRRDFLDPELSGLSGWRVTAPRQGMTSVAATPLAGQQTLGGDVSEVIFYPDCAVPGTGLAVQSEESI